MAVTDRGNEFQHDHRRITEGLGIKDLRSNVAMEALQTNILLAQGAQGQFLRLAGHNGGTELAVLTAGVDLFMGVRIDAGRKPQKDPLANALPSRFCIDGIQFIGAVAYKAANAMLNGKADVPVSLAVAVEAGIFHGEASPDSGIQLAGGDHIHTHIFLGHDLIHTLDAQCLAGIKRSGTGRQVLLHRLVINAAAVSHQSLIHHKQRCAVLLYQFGGIVAGKEQMSFRVGCQVLIDHFLPS